MAENDEMDHFEDFQDLEGEAPDEEGSLLTEDELGAPEPEITGPDHLNQQLEDDSGIEEALQAWAEGGHATEDYNEADEIFPVQLEQLNVDSVAKPLQDPQRLDNVMVDVSVELGRKEVSVKYMMDLQEQEVIELDKLAGEAFQIRINDKAFAEGEIVVVTDIMAVRITRLYPPPGSTTND